MKRQEFDAVVVGAGIAGLTAANVCACSGQRVLVLERGEPSTYACNSRIATGSLGVAHCDAEADPDVLYRAILDDTEGGADPALARAMANNVGRAFAWLRAEGIAVRKAVEDGKTRWVMEPPRPTAPGQRWKGRGPDLALRRLAQNLEARGGRLAFHARARELIMEEGACVGVRVEAGGARQEFSARAVILADGGFQANPDLVRLHISPAPDRLVQRNAGTGMGDALLMAQAVGARISDAAAFYGHLLAQEALESSEFWPYPTLDSLVGGAILVDSRGTRFIDEGLGGIPLSNAVARLADPLSAAVVFDQAIWESAGRMELIAPNPFLLELGAKIHSSATLSSLAAALGFAPDRLVATVEDYNAHVDEGRMADLSPARTLGRPFGALRTSPNRIPARPLRQPPFYAIRLCAGLTYTQGGVLIDPRCRAQDAQGRPIAGLLAAGSCTGGLEGGPIAGYIGGYLKAVCTGFVAGETVVAKAAD